MIDRKKTCDAVYEFLNRLQSSSVEQIKGERLELVLKNGIKVRFGSVEIQEEELDNVVYLPLKD